MVLTTTTLLFFACALLAHLQGTSSCVIPKCRCLRASVVDCSNLALTDVLSAEPHTEVEVLNLRGNHLREVPDLSSFPNLHTLDLSYNDISTLPEKAFQSLPQLSHLDISFNNLLLSDETVHMRSFDGLTQLKSLRMKQKQTPDAAFDYTALGPLNTSLEELFITGTQTFNLVNFTKLHTLSLGGSACNVTSLNATSQPTLTQLKLKRFSARNCGVKEIDRHFLQSFRGTLQKLDLSCNHLKNFLTEIMEGVAFSSLKALILDHINKDKEDCVWNNLPEASFLPLRNTPLQILSMQANQFGLQTKIDLRDACKELIYMDISQNKFGHATFRVGNHITSADKDLFDNWKLQPPSLKYLGLQGLTNNLQCGHYDKRILDCNEDSDLFLEDEYAWDHNHEPDILDFPVVLEVFVRHRSNFSHCDNPLYMHECLQVAKSILSDIGVGDYATERMIVKTIKFLRDQFERVNTAEKFPVVQATEKLQYIFVNVTKFAFGYNNFVVTDQANNRFSLCSNIKLYPNNLDTVDLSYSVLIFVPCVNITGLNYLTNITCRECSCSGWHKGLLKSFPLKYLDVSRNHLGYRLRNDVKGDTFGGASELETLLLGEQLGSGIQYFTNSAVFSVLPNLTHLDLHGNRLIAWNVSIARNTRLSVLDLRDNQIGYIEEKFRSELVNQTGLVVYLAGNDVTCSEANIDYLHWLTNSSFISDASDVRCLGGKRTVEDYLNLALVTLDTTGGDDSDNGQTATIVVTSCVTLAVIALLAIGWMNRYTLIYRCCSYRRRKYRQPQQNDRSDGNNEKLTVFASCRTEFTENLAALQDQLKVHQINLVSTELTVPPGAFTRAAIARLVAGCQKAIIFLTVGYMKDETTPFEFEMIKQKGLQGVILVTFGVDSANQIQHVPSALKDIITKEQHLVWPSGVCAGNDSNIQAFMTTLTENVLQQLTDEMT